MSTLKESKCTFVHFLSNDVVEWKREFGTLFLIVGFVVMGVEVPG